jgi:hypothetical protein
MTFFTRLLPAVVFLSWLAAAQAGEPADASNKKNKDGTPDARLMGRHETFVAEAEKGWYSFDTGTLRGRLRLDGKNQGVASLIHVPSGVEVAHGQLPGVLSLYRVFSTGTRYGDAARDWPIVSKLLSDGAVEATWAPSNEHPLEIVAVFRIAAADAIDAEITVKPRQAMPGCEVFLSNYFTDGFRASVYVKSNAFDGGKPAFLAADVNPLVEGSYLIFPRDRQAVQTIFDGRWERPPHPVPWSVTRWLAAPVAVRRHEPSGVAAVLMAPPEDCFAVSTPYNKTPPDGVANHLSLYLSLFGRDLAAGQTAKARTRLVVAQKPTDRQVLERYESYVRKREP